MQFPALKKIVTMVTSLDMDIELSFDCNCRNVAYRRVARYLKVNTHEEEFLGQSSKSLEPPMSSSSGYYMVVTIAILSAIN